MTEVGLVELHPFKSELCDIPEGMEIRPGDSVVVQDEEGEDLGHLISLCDSDESRSVILRKATPEDVAHRAQLDGDFHMNMRVVGAHWRLDRRKVCFYFASEERLDFRALHKAVSSSLNVRVAIKQIGVRDHARILGGLGACGRELCCKSFVRELKPIALRMARQQNLFVEPAKISGLCGKLLCCLAFEDQAYLQWLKDMPSVGSSLKTARGQVLVTAVDAARRRVSLRHEDGTEHVISLEDMVPRHEAPARPGCQACGRTDYSDDEG
jgi:cell fate regulator YaaT (PSP1 superfamily)